MPKSPSTVVRASAALPASGAYDTPTSILCANARQCEVFIAYTRSTTGGAFKLKVLASDDGTNFYERTVIDGSSLSSGAMNVFTAEYKFPVAAGATVERRSLIVDVSTCVAVQFSFAEYGVTATPGTLAAVSIFGN